MSSTVRPLVAKANYEEIMKLAGEPHNLLGFDYALQTVLKMVKMTPSESKTIENETTQRKAIMDNEGSRIKN